MSLGPDIGGDIAEAPHGEIISHGDIINLDIILEFLEIHAFGDIPTGDLPFDEFVDAVMTNEAVREAAARKHRRGAGAGPRVPAPERARDRRCPGACARSPPEVAPVMLTIAVVGLLGAWFVTTAIVQYPNPVGRWLRAHDPTGHLLPGWNFFAPKPIQGDFAVWYRSWGAMVDGLGEVVDASSTQWRELEGIERAPADRRRGEPRPLHAQKHLLVLHGDRQGDETARRRNGARD